MKLMTAAAVIALTTATAAYAQSGNNAPTNLTPGSQGRTTEMKGSRNQQDQSENQITEELNRQQAQLAKKFDNTQNGPAAPQTATKPDDMPMAPPTQ